MSNNLLLVLLGVIGLGTFVAGFSSSSNDLKEDFNGFGLRAVGTKTVKEMTSQGNGSMVPKEYSVDYTPMSSLYQKTVDNVYKPNTHPYSNSTYMLGSSANTSMPFVSNPGFQQSTPLTSPNIALPPMAKYKPTTLSNMGISPAYKSNCTVVEKYQPPVAGGFMGMKETEANKNPGAAYSAGNYSQVAMQKPCGAGDTPIDKMTMGETMSFTETGSPVQIQVFENLMYTNIKPGRTCRSGVRDMIRGDLPVCPNQVKGWFQAPSKPTDLQTGALQFMGGDSENTKSLDNFMKSYGATENPYQVPAGQQTIPQAMYTIGTGNRGTTAVSFA